MPIFESCSTCSGVSEAARARWLLTQAPSLMCSSLPVSSVTVSMCLRGTRRCCARSKNCCAASKFVAYSFVGVGASRLRLLARGCGLDAEDLLAHPLLRRREFLPAEGLCPHPVPKVLALADHLARLGRELPAGLQVEAGEVEAALPRQRPGRAPGGGDVVEGLASLVAEGSDRTGVTSRRQALFATLCVELGAAGGSSLVLQPHTDWVAVPGGVDGGEQMAVFAGPRSGGGEAFGEGDVEV